MIKLKSLFVLLSFLTPLLCQAAHAKESLNITQPIYGEKASYDIYYLGIPVGNIWMWWEEDNTRYKITTTLKTSGVASVFSKQKRTATLHGARDAESYVPEYYKADVAYSHKEKSVTIHYQDGKPHSVIRTPEAQTEITQEQLQSAVDPISALLQTLAFIGSDTATDAMFDSIVYDGKRLNRVMASPAAASKTCTAPCKNTIVSREPLAGYSEKKLARFAKGEPPVYLTMYPNRSRFPHSLYVDTRIGNVSIVRVANETQSQKH